MENNNISFTIKIKSVFKNSFVDKSTNEITTYYVAQLDNNLAVPITLEAINLIKNKDYNLCLINSYGKIKIDSYRDVNCVNGERIL